MFLLRTLLRSQSVWCVGVGVGVVCVSVCVAWCCVLLCCVLCVGVRVVCVVWHAENLRVQIQNASVCAGRTPVSNVTRAFCQHTRRRFESTHGGVLNLHTHTHNHQHTHTRHQQQRDGRTPTDVSLLILSYLHMSVCLSSHLHFSSRVSVSFLIYISLHMSLSARLAFFRSVLNVDDNEHSSSWLSLYTRP